MFDSGVEFLTKNITVDNQPYMIQIWDTAGQERFRSLRTPFYRGADCCLLVYAVDDESSFENLKLWKNEFLYYADIKNETFPFIVLGNKVDVSANEKKIDRNQAENWCSSNGEYPHIETSAKDATNVSQCFATAVRKTINSQSTLGEASVSNLASETPRINLSTLVKPKENCC